MHEASRIGSAPILVERMPPDFDRWSEVLALLQRCFAYMVGRIDPPSSLDRMTAADLGEKARVEMVYLARRGERLVGCAFARPQADALYLGKIAVDPAARGEGIARRMIDLAGHDARSLGLAVLELQSRVELSETHAVFYRLGFSKFAETAHAGYDRATSITMRKPL